jgi:hypothetical protein
MGKRSAGRLRTGCLFFLSVVVLVFCSGFLLVRVVDATVVTFDCGSGASVALSASLTTVVGALDGHPFKVFQDSNTVLPVCKGEHSFDDAPADLPASNYVIAVIPDLASWVKSFWMMAAGVVGGALVGWAFSHAAA